MWVNTCLPVCYMHSSTLLTGVCKNTTPLEWKPSASLVISLCSVRVFTLKLHATKKKKKKWARLHKSVFCSVPESLHGLRVVWRLSLMKWVTCNLETTKLLCLHANAAQFTSSPLLSKLEMLECLFNWASNLNWHAKRKKNGEKWLFFIFLHWTRHHQDTLQEYLLFFKLHWVKCNKHLLGENEIPGLQLWHLTTKQADQDCLAP